MLPDNLVDRLLSSNKIRTFPDSLKAQSIMRKVGEACMLMAERAGDLRDLQMIPKERIEEATSRFNAGTIALTDDEHSLLCELLDVAGDPDAFDARYADCRLGAPELRLYAPTYLDLKTPVVHPEQPPELNERQADGKDSR